MARKKYAVKVGKRIISTHYKKPRVIEISDHQIGKRKSIKKDRERKALPPGKRMSKTGNIYYEYRRNRTDKQGKTI